VEYGDQFIRNVWSRNIHHVGRLKLAWLDGVGLKRHSSAHTGAKQNAEIHILLNHYKSQELHSLCAGRNHDEALFVDDYQKGIQNLEGGRLKKWVNKTTRARGLMRNSPPDQCPTPNENMDSEDSDDDVEDEVPDTNTSDPAEALAKLRFPTIREGGLSLDMVDFEDDDLDEILEMSVSTDFDIDMDMDMYVD